jgi:hypothetical protein
MENAMSKATAAQYSGQKEINRRLDAALDEQLENTFPASDPPKIVLPRPSETSRDDASE